MKDAFTYLLVLCMLCVYGCSEELDIVENTPSTNVYTRSETEHFSCGTVGSEPPAWYFGAQTRALNDNGIYTLDVFVHVIRSSNGVGFNKETVSQTIINNLNYYYASAKINFFLWGNEYIDSDRYNNSTESDYKAICNTNSHVNAIDIYVLSDGAGWGDTVGRAEDIISSACVIQSHFYQEITVTHEVGHCLGLYHTHHGTSKREKGTPELVDGSNSAIAGDYITDTPADPCEWSWGMYVGTGTDANGAHYHPDPTNLMSYSWNYDQNKFSSEQIAKMRGVILQSDVVNSTIHQKQIIGPKHFSGTASYSLDVLNSDESVTWKVVAYSQGQSTTNTYTTSTLTLSSTKSVYYQITAQITSPNGSRSVVFYATCNAPSPYIGDLYWETNSGQYGLTNATEWGNALFVSGNVTLTMEYTDKAGNNSQTMNGFDFTCVTAAHRVLRGNRMSLTPDDCTQNLKIRTQNACGTSEEFFTIPCEVTNYYYAVAIESGRLVIDKVEVETEEINRILTAQKGLTLDDVRSQIKSVLVYTKDNQVVYSKNSNNGFANIQIDIRSWNTGIYYLSISDGKNIQHRKVKI